MLFLILESIYIQDLEINTKTYKQNKYILFQIHPIPYHPNPNPFQIHTESITQSHANPSKVKQSAQPTNN